MVSTMVALSPAARAESYDQPVADWKQACRDAGHPAWAFAGDGEKPLPVQMRPLQACQDIDGPRADLADQTIELAQQQATKVGDDGPTAHAQLIGAGWGSIRMRRLGPAMMNFNLAWRFDPGNGEAYHGMAVVLATANQSSEIVDYWFRQAVDAPRGRPGRFADYGRFLMAADRPEDARPMLLRNLELEPENAWSMMYMTDVHMMASETAEACAMIDRIQAAAPPPGFPPEQFAKLQADFAARRLPLNCPE